MLARIAHRSLSSARASASSPAFAFATAPVTVAWSTRVAAPPPCEGRRDAECAGEWVSARWRPQFFLSSAPATVLPLLLSSPLTPLHLPLALPPLASTRSCVCHTHHEQLGHALPRVVRIIRRPNLPRRRALLQRPFLQRRPFHLAQLVPKRRNSRLLAVLRRLHLGGNLGHDQICRVQAAACSSSAAGSGAVGCRLLRAHRSHRQIGYFKRREGGESREARERRRSGRAGLGFGVWGLGFRAAPITLARGSPAPSAVSYSALAAPSLSALFETRPTPL